jgi:metal-responsive CopG/Arc/MetJ family transcriptional regulator
MKVKTSVTLSAEVVRAIDRAAGKTSNRSRVLETAAREFLVRRARAERDALDLAILNRCADELNSEMADVLAYQADV